MRLRPVFFGPSTQGRTLDTRRLLGQHRWSPTGYDTHHRLMFDHFARITLANTFFDQRAVIFVERKILRSILFGGGLIHTTYFIPLSALMEVV
jgi:hypothetical protein